MNRNKIIAHIEHHIQKSGSATKVAKKCGISDTTLSLLLRGKYGANEQKVLVKIAQALDYRDKQWNLVRSLVNYRIIQHTYHDAKQESMWFCLSNPAGSGKTAAFEDIYNNDMTGGDLFIQAEEWTGRQLLAKMIVKTMGEEALRGKYKPLTEMIQIMAHFFNEKATGNPVLFIDEGDKLRPSAIRALIPLYNKTEDRLGLIISGTENLRKEIESGVRLRKKGFDEMESRFGRTYINLPGATKKEVFDICKANGVTDDVICDKIWTEIPKTIKPTRVNTPTGEKEKLIEYAEDFRRLKRLILRERLAQPETTVK